MAEEVDLEDRSIQIIQFEEQREKRLKTRNRHSEIHGNNIKLSNVCILGIPADKKKENGKEHIY